MAKRKLFAKLAKNVWIMGNKLLSVRFQGLLELNGSDRAVVLLEKRQGWERGWNLDSFSLLVRTGARSHPGLGEVVNCEGAWALPDSISLIMTVFKAESLLSY